MFSSHLFSLLGGVLIGLAAWLLLAALGRVAGISGIAADALLPGAAERAWRWAFLAGLVAAGTLAAPWLGVPAPTPQPVLRLVAAGLLVGFGTVLGSGCTSGHGVCGLGRRSPRSLAATAVFMAAGIATVFVARSLA
ncbi:YeeE/YedE thiosulfate transporter family protein [Ramlibacter sp. H39-3-26]|uniref:YeeE/YedE family protein n=1 Tax=Curvibacter soli TaxID=3031331 RepID=UPI0023DC23A8|nr:YeeE/YedE thiosulfate transporter family protein [Ramlibacter sp. H39-3-26]MDF1486423.1 YeeE/YedE thiosulfate transporter family protein [Ramlibacter sp. H39-3-26]